MSKTFFGLEHLFGSVTRAKLLRIFVHQPERRFFVRELARTLRTHVHAVRRELANLEKFGLIKPVAADASEGLTRRGPAAQRKYYLTNSDFPLLVELQALMTKADFLLHQSLTRKLQSLGTITYLALTGRLVGEPEIAIDLLIVGTIRRNRIKTVIREFEDVIGREINFTIMSRREYKYRKDITDKFLYGILEGKKVVLVDAAAGISLV